MNELRPFVGVAAKKRRRARLLINLVADEFEVDVADIYVQNRAARYSLPRMVAVSLLRTCLKMSWWTIATHFGYKTHSSALLNTANLDKKIQKDNDLKDTITSIIQRYNKEKNDEQQN